MTLRRHFLKQAGAIAALSLVEPKQLFATQTRRFKIGACDWSIGKRSDPSSFQLAKQIGVQGLMIDMGSKENNLHLRNPEVQKDFLSESKNSGVAISSLAIAELNTYPLKSDPQTEEWVFDSIVAAGKLQVPVLLLAFFHNNDLRGDEKGINEVITRLKRLVKEAEKQKVILGIESYLDAAGHLRIMDAIGSDNLKIYLDFRNTADAGYDMLKEVKQMGKNNICELHMKENGSLLGKGDLPWQKIRDTLYEMDYYGDGWMQIEGAIPEKGDVLLSYQQNLSFLQELFADKI